MNGNGHGLWTAAGRLWGYWVWTTGGHGQCGGEEGGGGGKGLCTKKWPDKIFPMVTSIAFGSAPRREADSQPISQLVRQAVSQAVSRASGQADRQTETHSLGFFSGRLGYKQWGAQCVGQQSAVEPPTMKGRFDTYPPKNVIISFRG